MEWNPINLFKRKKEPLYIIEMGGNYLHLAVVGREGDRFSLKNFRSFHIRNGIKNPDFWALLEKHIQEIYTPDINLSYLVFSPDYTVSYAKLLPLMPRAEALSHCRHVITHSMNIKIDDYYMECKVNKIEGQDLIAGMALSVTKEVTDRTITILGKLGIEVLKIETSIMAVESLFSNCKLIPKEGSIWALRLEEEYSEMFVLKDRFVVHYATIDFGLKDIKSSLVRTVYTKTGPVEINYKEAESVVDELGYPLGEGHYLIKDRQRLDILNKVSHEEEKGNLEITYQQLRILMSPALETLCEKLNVFIQEYKHDFPAEQLAGIYLFGEGGEIKGLGEFIESKLSLPHLYFDPISISGNIDLDTEAASSSPLTLEIMLGCLYPAVRKYNLLPSHYKIIQETHKAKNKLFFYLAVLLVFLMAFYSGIRLDMFYLEKIIGHAKDAYSKSSPAVKKLEIINKLTQEIAVLDKNISQIHSQYPDWIGILKELSNSIPDEIVLSSIESKTDTQKSTLLLSGSVVAGEDSSKNAALNQFVEKLEQAPYFKKVEILNTKNYANELFFELECLLN